jgi:hypothetical protein
MRILGSDNRALFFQKFRTQFTDLLFMHVTFFYDSKAKEEKYATTYCTYSFGPKVKRKLVN